MPTQEELRQFAAQQGVDVGAQGELLEAYGRFVTDGVRPPEDLVGRFYDIHRRPGH